MNQVKTQHVTVRMRREDFVAVELEVEKGIGPQDLRVLVRTQLSQHFLELADEYEPIGIEENVRHDWCACPDQRRADERFFCRSDGSHGTFCTMCHGLRQVG